MCKLFLISILGALFFVGNGQQLHGAQLFADTELDSWQEQDVSQGGDSIIHADASGVRYWTAPLLEGTVVEAGSERLPFRD